MCGSAVLATADREKAEDEYRFEGKVTAMGPGYLDINDQTVSINGDTELEGTLAIGLNVEVKALLQYANTFVAKGLKSKNQTRGKYLWLGSQLQATFRVSPLIFRRNQKLSAKLKFVAPRQAESWAKWGRY